MQIDTIKVQLTDETATVFVYPSEGGKPGKLEIFGKGKTGPKPALVISFVLVWIRERTGLTRESVPYIMTGTKNDPTTALINNLRSKPHWLVDLFRTEGCLKEFLTKWLLPDTGYPRNEEHPSRSGRWYKVECGLNNPPLEIARTVYQRIGETEPSEPSHKLSDIQDWLRSLSKAYKEYDSSWKDWEPNSKFLEATEASEGRTPPPSVSSGDGVGTEADAQSLPLPEFRLESVGGWIEILRSDLLWSERTSTCMSLQQQDSVTDSLRMREMHSPFNHRSLDGEDYLSSELGQCGEHWNRGRLLEMLSGNDLRDGALILGDPGSGKSILIGTIARDLVEAGADASLPILIRLNAFDRWVGEKGRVSFWSYFFVKLCGRHQSQVDGDVHQLRREAECGSLRVVVLLDGWDEIPVGRREVLADALDEEFRGLPLIMTSRPSGNPLKLAQRFRHFLRLDPLDERNRNDVVRSICVGLREEGLAHRVTERMESSPLKDLPLSTPLSITMACEIVLFGEKDGLMPENRFELFEKWVRLSIELYNRHNEPRPVTRVDERCLWKLAYGMVFRSGGMLACFSGIDYLAISGSSGAKMSELPVVQSRLLNKLVVSSDGYRFSHMRLRDYFAACAFIDLTDDDKEEVLERFGRHLDWYPIWTFVAGGISEPENPFWEYWSHQLEAPDWFGGIYYLVAGLLRETGARDGGLRLIGMDLRVGEGWVTAGKEVKISPVLGFFHRMYPEFGKGDRQYRGRWDEFLIADPVSIHRFFDEGIKGSPPKKRPSRPRPRFLLEREIAVLESMGAAVNWGIFSPIVSEIRDHGGKEGLFELISLIERLAPMEISSAILDHIISNPRDDEIPLLAGLLIRISLSPSFPMHFLSLEIAQALGDSTLFKSLWSDLMEVGRPIAAESAPETMNGVPGRSRLTVRHDWYKGYDRCSPLDSDTRDMLLKHISEHREDIVLARCLPALWRCPMGDEGSILLDLLDESDSRAVKEAAAIALAFCLRPAGLPAFHPQSVAVAVMVSIVCNRWLRRDNSGSAGTCEPQVRSGGNLVEPGSPLARAFRLDLQECGSPYPPMFWWACCDFRVGSSR